MHGAPARVVLLGDGGVLLADRIAGPGAAADRSRSMRGTERIVAIGQGAAPSAAANRPAHAHRADGVRAAPMPALAGWHAGAQMPYAGWSTALGPGCVVHASGDRLALHRERLDAGWVSGAELAQGVSTVDHHLRGAGAHGA